MPSCVKCQSRFPNRVKFGCQTKNVSRRKYCFKCSPFGVHNTRQLHMSPSKRRAREWSVSWQRKARLDRKRELVNLKGGGCRICGYDRVMRALHFHHVDPNSKSFELSQSTLGNMSWARIVAEAAKTVCLCVLHHVEVEAGLHVDKVEEWKKLL